jgi:hypothetical protein
MPTKPGVVRRCVRMRVWCRLFTLPTDRAQCVRIEDVTGREQLGEQQKATHHSL